MNLEEVERKLQEHESRIRALEGAGIEQQAKTETKRGLSIKEFILSKEPTSEPQKVLTMGYFLEKHTGKAEFTSEDIEEAYRQAREPLPINLSETIAKNVRKGHIMEGKVKIEGKKIWTLTSSGLRAVEVGFKGTLIKKRRFRLIKKETEVPVVAGA